MEVNTIVSPCEGKILKITRDGNFLLVSTFLNIHNVHVQYFPCYGIVIKKEYKEGEFQPAYLFEKSKYNEQLQTTILTKYGHLKINQIAGLIASRIVSFNKINDRVEKGQPLGLIKFGSRVDMYIPINHINNVNVKEGDVINIGDTICKMFS
jgi:phosphatidylserine decarboxylase